VFDASSFIVRGILIVVMDFSTHLRRFWCGFLPAPGVSGTVSELSVDVDDGSAGFTALCLCGSDIADHMSTVRWCLACGANSIKSPCPTIAWSASQNCPTTSCRNLSIRSGSCCGFYSLCPFHLFPFTLQYVYARHIGSTLIKSSRPQHKTTATLTGS